MDRKTCLWLKRSPVKSLAVNNDADFFVNGGEEKVAPVFCKCNSEDRIVAEYTIAEQECNTGRERPKALVVVQKEEPEDSLHHKVRLIHLYAALKKCKDEIRRLESKYTHARKKLANLTVENARLTKSLAKKEEIIKNISTQMLEAKQDFDVLISRLDSTEKGTKILKYEYHLLEKELKVRGRHVDMANRQHLEAERQKLRLLARKRVPGPTRSHQKIVDGRMSLIVKHLCEVEEENKILKECAFKKEHEVRLLKAKLAQMNDDCETGKFAIVSLDAYSSNKDNIDMEAKILESDKKVVSLETEIEFLKESKRMTDDHFENVDNLNLVNVDLDQQLYAAKLEIKEALRKVSFLEMELEERSHHFGELEATCLELQLQLASVSTKYEITEDPEGPEQKLHQTGQKATTELTNSKRLTQRFSLRDHLVAANGCDMKDPLNSPMIKEIINTTETKEPSVPCYGVENVVTRRLPLVTCKKRSKGTELLRRFLFRRKRGGKKMKLFAFPAFKI